MPRNEIYIRRDPSEPIPVFDYSVQQADKRPRTALQKVVSGLRDIVSEVTVQPADSKGSVVREVASSVVAQVNRRIHGIDRLDPVDTSHLPRMSRRKALTLMAVGVAGTAATGGAIWLSRDPGVEPDPSSQSGSPIAQRPVSQSETNSNDAVLKEAGVIKRDIENRLKDLAKGVEVAITVEPNFPGGHGIVTDEDPKSLETRSYPWQTPETIMIGHARPVGTDVHWSHEAIIKMFDKNGNVAEESRWAVRQERLSGKWMQYGRVYNAIEINKNGNTKTYIRRNQPPVV